MEDYSIRKKLTSLNNNNSTINDYVVYVVILLNWTSNINKNFTTLE